MYKIGDKVETEKGNGIIVAISGYEEQLYIVEITNIGEWGFYEHQLKAHRTAHEKLIEMGYETIKGNNCVFYRHDELPKITIYSDNTYSCSDTNLELSRILTQYLEELEELK